MLVLPVRTPVISVSDDIIEVTVTSLRLNNLALKDKDVLIYAETVVGTTQNRITDEDKIEDPSAKALELAEKYEMAPKYVQLILDEADVILGGVRGVLLTEKDGVLIANAGIDRSNSGGLGKISMFPIDPFKTAFNMRVKLMELFKLQNLGIIIADSRVQPMRRGVVGVAIGVSGFEPIDDCRGRKDIFGYELEFTTRAVADDLTSAAEMLMGEADEQIPIVLIRDAPLTFTDRNIEKEELIMPRTQCLFMNVFKDLAAYQKPEFTRKEN